MTSKERHEFRYQRRKKRREERDINRSERNTSLENIFGHKALMNGYKATSKASRKRASTQTWMANLAVNARIEQKRLESGRWKSRGFNEFVIRERGKTRKIQSVHISEKGIQNSLCNNCLIPILKPHLIYDNGASLKGKGTDFALGRFTEHLRYHIRKYGTTGWIYFFDFTGYFSNINNVILKRNVGRYLQDSFMMNSYSTFVDAFGGKGLGLGSQISQISAVFFPNAIDHMIKDRFGVHGYARYMDDGYVIHHDLDKLKEIIKAFESKCKDLGIILNRKKCKIYKLTDRFVFLKTRFHIQESGEIEKHYVRMMGKRERKKLRAYRRFLDMGLMTYREVCLNFHSWLLGLNRCKCAHFKYNMIMLFNSLFSDCAPYDPKMISSKHKALHRKRYRELQFLSRIATQGGKQYGFYRMEAA